ncbi:MAG: hypothetical protein ACOXZX_01010, partial [Synergistaceae bacterium]
SRALTEPVLRAAKIHLPKNSCKIQNTAGRIERLFTLTDQGSPGLLLSFSVVPISLCKLPHSR